MIVLNLCCDKEHLFEGWFGSAEAYDEQRSRHLVACPLCGSTAIDRRPSAPYVQTRPATTPAASAKPATDAGSDAPVPAEAVATLMKLLRRAARQSEDVGETFPEEARRIHYGESEARNIRGQASRDELGELLDEGIMVLPVPPDEGDLH